MMGNLYRNQQLKLENITNALDDIARDITELRQELLLIHKIQEDLTQELEKIKCQTKQ